jgi:hypothetical protein
MKNIFASLFGSVLNSFRRDAQSRKSKRANAPSITPEQFRDMFTKMLADPESQQSLIRRMRLFMPVYGGTSTAAADVSSGEFGNNIPDTGNYNFSVKRRHRDRHNGAVLCRGCEIGLR